LSVEVPAGPPSRDGGYRSSQKNKAERTKERPRSNKEKTLSLWESTGLLREHFGVHRGAKIDLATMVTTRNHDNQQINQEENSSAIGRGEEAIERFVLQQ